MRTVSLVICISFLAACSDDTGVTADKGGQSDTLVTDAQAGDSAVTDGPLADSTKPGDAEPADGSKPADGPQPTDGGPKPVDGGPKPVDGGPKPVDGGPKPVDSATPVDAGPAADASSSFQVKIDKVSVWADLMPPVSPDPTHVTLTLSFTNTGKQPVKNITLTQAAILAVKGGKATPIQLVAQSFGGSVPGGQTVQATFKKVLATTTTPLPAKCGDNVQVRFTVSFNGGTVGPLTTSAVPFTCAY
jgi:hypothetical protein